MSLELYEWPDQSPLNKPEMVSQFPWGFWKHSQFVITTNLTFLNAWQIVQKGNHLQQSIISTTHPRFWFEVKLGSHNDDELSLQHGRQNVVNSCIFCRTTVEKLRVFPTEPSSRTQYTHNAKLVWSWLMSPLKIDMLFPTTLQLQVPGRPTLV